jgi:nuclear pore complex protein Nup50
MLGHFAGQPTSDASGTVQYQHQLKMLNESVLKWVDQHVKSNPYCILTPVFEDYNRYVTELERKFPVVAAGTAGVATTTPAPAGHDSTSKSLASKADSGVDVTANTERNVMGANNLATTSGIVTAVLQSTSVSTSVSAGSSLFSAATTSTSLPSSSFSSPCTSSSAASPPATVQATASVFSSASSFGTAGSTTFAPFGTSGTTSIFGAGGAGGFSFGGFAPKPADGTTQQSSSAAGNDEEEEYVPPKPEVVEIKEDDAFYTVRCKLFFMISNQWQERGVGALYLKPCANDKTQLLIRADNTLGTILLNIMLTKSIPTSLQGKTNVSLSCIPNPPLDASKTPVCMLIRVKTADVAAELLQKINESKK